MDEYAISFGPYRLLAEQRLLLEGDRPVRLGSRAFDILAALVERPGEVVGKEELIARAWPQTFVEEANLKIQMSALRRALGDGQGGNRYVITVPGRGYNFVAPIRREEPSRASPPAAAASAARHNLPFAVTRMIGRDDTVAAVISRLSRERLVTIVGPGGVGKTTVALAVAERMIVSYEHGVWLVDLAPLGDPRLVASAAATVLGLEIRTENPLAALVAAVRDKRMLLLLDNCEHVIEAAAGLAAAILSGAPGVNILATSREPLGIAGEREYRLASLGIPQASSRSTAAEAAAFPAVQLFVERVSAIVEDFALTDANTPAVVEICRGLDGLPLAIEFAAPRVEVLGVEGLAARLGDSLPLLAARRRTAIPRQRTMRSVVDWSYGLLSGDEQGFLRSLGIFAGGFTVEAAAAVVPDAAKTRNDAIDRLADLATKSLVVVDASGARPRFRLLDTTRAYAIGKLDESGERERIARRHAEYYRNLFERAEGEASARSTGEWLADYAREIDNLRAALDWAFSSDGDASIGAALTVSAIPLWFELSRFPECRQRTESAIALVGPSAGDVKVMQLHAAFAASLFHTSGPIYETVDAWATTLQIATTLGATEYQLRALWGLWSFRLNSGEHQAALALADEFGRLVRSRGNQADLPIADRMMGTSLHYLGDQCGARQHVERMLENYVGTTEYRYIVRFQLAPRMATKSILARVLWLQGFSDQALRIAEQNVKDALTVGHTVTLFNVLMAAGLVALLAGDEAAASYYVAQQLDHSQRQAMSIWTSWAQGVNGILLIQKGDAVRGLEILQKTMEHLHEVKSFPRFGMFSGSTAIGLAQTGRIDDGLAVIGEAIDECERNSEGWIVPELIRVKGTLLQMGGAKSQAEKSEDHFRRSLQLAQSQGALAWELRAATSLARLMHRQGHDADARACLQPVFGRFTEGFGTADLIAAKQLLDELSDAGRQ
jgi:predicted ATPase/DNA-binding winged helix-turn-helix (wHTH) protein